MNEEALGVDGKPYRIVNQCKGYEGEHHRQRQQHKADVPYILIDGIDQLFPIEHILYVRVLLDHFLYLRDTVGIGIIGVKLDFKGGRERVIAKKLFGIGAHRLRLLFQSLFFGDVLGLLHKRFLIQFLLEFQNIRLLHVITDKNGETDIFADVYRHIVRREHKEHNQPQQQQHQCRTDTGRYELHIEQ